VAVIVDLTVPGGMGGKETAEHIRKMDTEIPIIVSSGYSDDDIIQLPQRYGFAGSIGKPFTSEELLEVISKHVQ
jgi:CheY-like chemotaxis protein